MHQLTGDFYTVGEILGHTLKGIGMSLGISTNLKAVTARYVDVRLERKKDVLDIYHRAVHDTGKDAAAGEQTKNQRKRVTIWSYEARNFLQVRASFYIVLGNVGGKKASAYAVIMNILYVNFYWASRSRASWASKLQYGRHAKTK